MKDSHGRGFVLSRAERGETDLYVELLLDDGRLVRAVAKGAARSSRRFSAGLSPFTLYRFVFGRTSSRVSERLDEASVERIFPGLLTDLKRTAAAGAASVIARDLGGEVTHDDATLFELYAGLVGALETADAAGSGAGLVRFAFEAFEHAGHPIVLDGCVRCGRVAPDNATVQLSPEAGGVVCGACGGGAITLRAAQRRALRAVLDGDASAFSPVMLGWLARVIGGHAARGATTVAHAATHWG